MEADIAAAEADAPLNRLRIRPIGRRDYRFAHFHDLLPIIVTPALRGLGARP
jgi:hypothetical protein